MATSSEISYSLAEADMLNFQMYAAGDSKAVRRRILVGRVLLPVICVLLSALFGLDGDIELALAFLIPGVLFAVFMPCLIKAQHRRHFRNHIREKLQGMLHSEAKLIIEPEGLRSIGTDSEGVIK